MNHDNLGLIDNRPIRERSRAQTMGDWVAFSIGKGSGMDGQFACASDGNTLLTVAALSA